MSDVGEVRADGQAHDDGLPSVLGPDQGCVDAAMRRLQAIHDGEIEARCKYAIVTVADLGVMLGRGQ